MLKDKVFIACIVIVVLCVLNFFAALLTNLFFGLVGQSTAQSTHSLTMLAGWISLIIAVLAFVVMYIRTLTASSTRG
jgi:hypothetical protein